MAFCQYCGSEIPDDSNFCPNCGATQDVQQNGFQPNSNMYDTQHVELPMNWYKFLIYFALFLGAISNAYTGIQMLTGAHYEGSATYVYAFYSSLKVIDIVVGIACIGLAVLAIVVRQKLANFKSDGPRFLTILYVASIAVSLIYILLITIVVGNGVFNISNVASVISSGAMIFVNKIYFEKRQHLFVN